MPRKGQLTTFDGTRSRCSACKEWKEVAAFPRSLTRPSGCHVRCRTCDAIYRKRNKNPVRERHYSLRKKYGITPEQYQNLVNKQNGLCAICKTAAIENIGGALFVDHCHKSSLIRGLLCHQCNIGLGSFKDCTDLLYSAIEYLNGSYLEVVA